MDQGASPPHRIDVHHHLFPPAYIAQLARREHYLSRGPAAGWTPQVSIEDMDRSGVELAVMSITAPGFEIVEPALLRRLARDCNEYAARMAADHPGRFGVFAALPLPEIDAALDEIAYALDTLGADGIGLLTSYAGRWLGDPAFAPVLDELDRREAVVYVHPTVAECCRNLMPAVQDWVIEYPVDTTRTVASLLFSGTVRRCPRIRFVFAHAGGILPLLVEHFARAARIDPALAATVPAGVAAELRRFHYDIALRAHPVGLASALEMVPASQLLFGTDGPLRTCAESVAGLAAYGLDPDDLHAIECGNARRLLPRFRSSHAGGSLRKEGSPAPRP